jgi:hypothetical protein
LAATVSIAKNIRLRDEPLLEAFAPVLLPPGTATEVMAESPPGWVRLRGQVDGQMRSGWCMRRMYDAALHNTVPSLPSAERRMWALIEQYTGQVGYKRGAKAASLGATPPVIDCSGWVALMLDEAMTAENEDADIDLGDPWSDRLIMEIEARTPELLEGSDITTSSLPRCAIIGFAEGYSAWQENRPRLRGINHIALLMRRPADQEPFVSESYSINPGGVRLTPLASWLDIWANEIQGGKAWAVNPFALANPHCRPPPGGGWGGAWRRSSTTTGISRGAAAIL